MLEAEFKSTWQDHFQPAMTEAELAFESGTLADRLAFLFIAGYMAAVRNCFETPDRTFTVFALSEDQHPDNPLPGLIVDDRGRLNGSKTWVACSDTVDEIVVSARQGDSVRLFRVSREQPGLSIITRQDARFLAEMSQGTATFDNVALTDLVPVPSMDPRYFARREPLFLYLAFCGFLYGQGNIEAPSLRDRLTDLSHRDLTSPEDRSALAELDDAVTARMLSLDSRHFAGDHYEADRRLIRLYSPVIQKRAGKGEFSTP